MGKKSAMERTQTLGIRLTLMPRGLKEKLLVAFSLMSVMPLLVLGYVIVNYVFPHLKSIGDLSIVVSLVVFIALLGWMVARSLVAPVVKLSAQAQAIAAGDLEQQADAAAPDEVGSLGSAINQIAQQVRENMSQLRVYGEQTKHLNLEINRRVLALSDLLQVINLITQSAKIEEIIRFILEKLSQVEENEFSCLLEGPREDETFLIRAASGADSKQVQNLQGARVSGPWLARAIKEKRTMILVDAEHVSPTTREMVQQLLGMRNGSFQPLFSMGQTVGVLVCANRREGFVYREEMVDLLKIFGKQMALAIENDLLSKRAEGLKVIDELTGLYTAGYMKSRMEEEVRRAMCYHRPCSLVVLNVDDFQRIQKLHGALAAEGVLHQVGKLLSSQASEVDRVGRLGPDEFVVILPEKNKREAIEWAQSICRLVGGASFRNGPDVISRSVTVSGGVSENPLDGRTAEELLKKANTATQLAKAKGKNRIMTV